MLFRNLKNTELQVSRIALGTWIFGGRRWGSVNPEESVETIHFAFEQGINLIDTSDAYGDGLSETLIGEACKGRRDKFVFATKVGVVWKNDGSGVYHDLSEKHLLKAVDRSLKRLNTDYIDLYQLHEMDDSTPIEETGLALKRLIEVGKIRYVGVSNFNEETIKKLMNIVPVVSTQSEYNLIKRSIENDFLKFCKDSKLDLLTYSPLHRGILSGKFASNVSFKKDDNRFYDEEFQGEKFQKNYKSVELLKEIAIELNTSPTELAISWILHNELSPIVICGARNPTQLKNIIIGSCYSMSKSLYNRISSIFN